MHELRDDALERELARLSEYSGSPDAPPTWQAAMDAHRRERDRQVWVWVRRPAPALAAACLAVLVAAVALRPAPNRITNFDAGDRTSFGSLAESDANRSLPRGPGGIGGGGGGLATDRNAQLPRELTQDTRGIDNLTARTDLDAAKELGTAGNLSPEAARRMAVRYTDSKTGVGAGETSLEWKDGHGGVTAESLTEPPAPSTTVTLGLSDVNHFYYKALPGLVNQKLGDQLADHQLLGEQAKDAALGVRVTLKVNENRLPQVLEELRKTGTVQVEEAEIPSKETRLSWIDARLEAEKKAAAQFAETPVEKLKSPGAAGPDPNNTPAKPAAALDELAAARSKVEADIELLSRRREQIEKEGELATLNVVAVPESTFALKKKADIAEAAGAAAGGRPHTDVGARPAGGAHTDLADKSALPTSPSAPPPAPANRTEAPAQAMKGAKPANVGAKVQDATRLAAKTEDSTVPPAPAPAGSSPASTDPAPSQAGAKGHASGATPPPGAARDAEKSRDEYPKTFNRKQAPPPPTVQPAPAVTDAPPPAGAATTSAAPAPSKDTLPKSEVAGDRQAGTDGAKIGRAAREGWSNLGDSTASLVRTAIGTMLYWVPALIALIGGLWWYRRRKAEQMREPPPSA